MPRAELSSCVICLFFLCLCLLVCVWLFFFRINIIKHCNTFYETYLQINLSSIESSCIKHFRSLNIINQTMVHSTPIYLSNRHANILRKHAEVSIPINLAYKWTAFGSLINTKEHLITNVTYKHINIVCKELN